MIAFSVVPFSGRISMFKFQLVTSLKALNIFQNDSFRFLNIFNDVSTKFILFFDCIYLLRKMLY